MARGKTEGRYSPRRRIPEERGGGTWLTTYGDLVTLLLAFFVLLYAMSSVDVAKFEAFVSGLAVPFGNQAGAGILPASDGLTEETSDTIQPPVEVETAATDPGPTPPIVELTEAADEESELEAEAEDASRRTLEEIEAALQASLEAEGLEPLVERRREERGLVVSIASDDVLFALGSTDISEVGYQVIRTVARTLGEFDNDVLVEGHTDDLPLERGRYTNWNLSTDRAVAVLSTMVDRHSFPPARIGAVGFGEHRPINANEGASSRARNRRVDVVVLREEITP